MWYYFIRQRYIKISIFAKKIAENIISKAEESDVPIVYNKELTDLLCNVDVGEEIPSELYEAVAHVIAYITDIDKRIGR